MSIESIIDVNEENDLDSPFILGDTSVLLTSISRLNDFELLYFMAKREEKS